MSALVHLFMKETMISMLWSEQHPILKLHYNQHPSNLAEIRNYWPELSKLCDLCKDLGVSSVTVPFHVAEQVCHELESCRDRNNGKKKLQITISEDIHRLRVLKQAPESFVIRYVFENGILHRNYSHQVEELEHGWFRWNDQLWNYPLLTDALLTKLQQKEINEQQLLDFVQNTIPELIRCGVSIQCDARYISEPSVLINIDDVTSKCIRFLTKWNIQPNEVVPQFNKSGYVLTTDGIIRPGLTPSEVSSALGSIADINVLENEACAHFLEYHYHNFKPWMTGSTQAFEDIHHWLTNKNYWIIQSEPNPCHGVGKPVGQAYAVIGHDLVSWVDLTNISQSSYWRFSDGWMKQSDITQLLSQVTKPTVTLSTERLLCKGDAKLNTAFKGMKLKGPVWYTGDKKHLSAQRHLEWLLYWGINGGISGGYEAFVAYGIPFLQHCAKQDKRFSCIIAGSNQDIHALKKLYPDMEKDSQFTIVSPTSTPVSRNADVLVMIEPEQAFPLSNKQRVIDMIHCICKIGFFNQSGSLMNADETDLASSILSYRKHYPYLAQLIRDIRKPVELPPPYQFENSEWHDYESIKLYDMSNSNSSTSVQMQDMQSEAFDAMPSSSNQQTDSHTELPIIEIEFDDFVALMSESIPSQDMSQPVPARNDQSATTTSHSAEAALPPLQLDMSSIEQLRSESDEVRNMLISTLEDIVEQKNESDTLKAELKTVQATVQQAVSSDFQLDLNSIHQLRSETDEVRSNLLAALEENEQQPIVNIPDDIPTSNDMPFDDEWTSFFHAAPPDELKACLGGSSALKQYAASHHTMVDQILDHINNIAMDTIGDLLVDENGIIEDYLPMIEQYTAKE